MSNLNSQEHNEAIGNNLVVPTNKACIKGIDYSEIDSLLSVIDIFDTDNYQKEIKLVRLFVKKLHDNLKSRESFKTPLVKGLTKVDDDFTFITYTQQLREGLWA